MIVSQNEFVPPWDLAKWRLANIAMGICIQTVVTFTVFPVTSRSHVEDLTAQALKDLADLVAVVFDEMTGDAENQGNGAVASDAKSKGRRSPAECSTAVLTSLRKIALLSREARYEQYRLWKWMTAVFRPMVGKRAKLGAHRLEVMYQMRSLLTEVYVSSVYCRFYSSRGVWTLEDHWRASSRTFAKQLEASIRALRLSVLNMAPLSR